MSFLNKVFSVENNIVKEGRGHKSCSRSVKAKLALPMT